ncbi:30S ribosome-binding factor RbfA [Desulfitibacter alkalitolerans]|uniref:30S ribosome-binding factor RbfA n=1 Tax=Desulfitibacter alkalitolerans TaxID=264641 RepID=UPI0004818E46|nr:30S ribosome-binding factor RbfA [Desulfitibacter alkalitolerans]
MVSVRTTRVAEQMKKEIAAIIEHQVKDPRIGFITITNVELSNDLRHAKIFFSSLGNEEQQKKSLEGLENAKGFIRKEIAQRIQLRYAPEILFRIDNSIEHGVKISQILSKIKSTEEAEKEQQNES